MVFVLSIAGNQVPETPLVEVVGKAANGLPEHIGATGSKTAKIGFTTIVKYIGLDAH